MPYTEPWEYEFDATKEAEPCVQGGAGGVDHKGQEDCLYLNLYIPKVGQHWHFTTAVEVADL